MGGSLSIDKGYQKLYGENSNRINPMMILKGTHNAPVAWIGIDNGWRGPEPLANAWRLGAA